MATPASPSLWQRRALALAALVPRERLEPMVVARADEAGRRRWIIAVSGGSDSVALALLVWAHWPRQRDRLVLAHFNHRLRGRESGADARFCRALARGLGVESAVGAWREAPAAPNEAQARAARLKFLDTVRRQWRARWLWTGHQQDDVAETLLMRLARGSGTAGLAAPRPVQPIGEPGGEQLRLRPLLNLRREEIREALREVGATWREDSSNASTRHLRNRMRGQVVPRWEAASARDAVAGAALSRRLLAEDDAALAAWLEELAPFAPDGRLHLRRLEGKPIALWRRALQSWLSAQSNRGDLSRQGFENLLAMARDGGTRRFSLGTGGFVRIRRGWLFFEQPSVD